MHWLKPKRLAKFLKVALDNGDYRLTYEEIAQGIFNAKRLTRAELEQVTDEIRRCWHAAEKHLRRRGVCVILVTQFYFDNFDRREPKKAQQIAMCIAGSGYDRAAAGVRLLSLKGTQNDPMAIMYFKLRSRNLHGMESALLDRVTVESTKGKLTKSVARTLSDSIAQPALPQHEVEFAKLMRGRK